MTILVDVNSNPFELACACEVFATSRASELGHELYRATVATPTATTRMRDGVFAISGTAGLESLEDAETVVVPNRPDIDIPTHPRILDEIRAAHRRGARLIGLCTGAFTLAEAGVLHDRPATVHWQLLEEFATRYPRVDVRPDVLYVDDGDVLTSAGGAAALDLALHVVRTDYGSAIANTVSRRLVFSGFRDGGQKQFVHHPVPDAEDPALGLVLEWARDHLASPVTVSMIARRLRVSPATLFRRFRSELGMTPLQWLSRERIAVARSLLEDSQMSIDAVASHTGLGSAANFRIVFKRAVGVTPSAFRDQFSAKIR